MKKIVISNEEMFSQVAGLLAQGKNVTIPVKGLSMLPFIVGERDLVVLEPYSSWTINDIVLFQIHGRWILHRIIGFDGDIAIIKGDGVLVNKERCPIPQLVGHVKTILRKGTKEIDPYSKRSLRRLRFWNRLRPFRRYILFAYRHLPWMRKYFKDI